MRGAWLVCALSLARADRVSPLPADPELNAKWLEDFRRDLLRDAYDDETYPRPSPSILGEATNTPNVYFTQAPENTSDSMPRAPDRTSDKLPARRALDARSVRRMKGGTWDMHMSDRPGRLPDEPGVSTVRQRPSRTGSKRDAVRHISSRPPLRHRSSRTGSAKDADGPSGTLDGRLFGFISVKPLARHQPDDARDPSGRPVPAPGRRSLDDAASRELGISRRDLYEGRGFGSITDDGSLDAMRQPFLNRVHEFDDQMVPVVVQHGANSDNRLRRARKSRNRLWDENSEQNQDKPPYIMDEDGIKRYKVHTNPRERYRNRFGADEPGFQAEWGIDEFDEMRGPTGDRYQERGDENLAQNEDDRNQESRDESSSREERISVETSQELNVSEYQQENVRSRYIQQLPPEGDYAQQFSARRDAALLADGLASSSKPCNCMRDHPQIVPEL